MAMTFLHHTPFKYFFKIFSVTQIMQTKRSKSLLFITKLIIHWKVDARIQIDIEKKGNFQK